MSSHAWAYLFGGFLVIHGVGHAAGLWMGNRIFAAVWLVGLAGFVAAGLAFLGVVVPREWWRALAVASAVVSLVAVVPWWRSVPQAFIADAGVLMAVLWWHWPVPLAGP